jgi:hypothetical protein
MAYEHSTVSTGNPETAGELYHVEEMPKIQHYTNLVEKEFNKCCQIG